MHVPSGFVVSFPEPSFGGSGSVAVCGADEGAALGVLLGVLRGVLLGVVAGAALATGAVGTADGVGGLLGGGVTSVGSGGFTIGCVGGAGFVCTGSHAAVRATVTTKGAASGRVRRKARWGERSRVFVTCACGERLFFCTGAIVLDLTRPRG